MKAHAPHTCQQILRHIFGVVRSLTIQARGCGGGLYWKMHGRCGCLWSRYGEYPRLIVMSDECKAHIHILAILVQSVLVITGNFVN